MVFRFALFPLFLPPSILLFLHMLTDYHTKIQALETQVQATQKEAETKAALLEEATKQGAFLSQVHFFYNFIFYIYFMYIFLSLFSSSICLFIALLFVHIYLILTITMQELNRNISFTFGGRSPITSTPSYSTNLTSARQRIHLSRCRVPQAGH
jgi:hypothetical protein